MATHTNTLPDDTYVYRWFGTTMKSFVGAKGRRQQCAEIEERAGGTVAGGRRVEMSAADNGAGGFGGRNAVCAGALEETREFLRTESLGRPEAGALVEKRVRWPDLSDAGPLGETGALAGAGNLGES